MRLGFELTYCNTDLSITFWGASHLQTQAFWIETRDKIVNRKCVMVTDASEISGSNANPVAPTSSTCVYISHKQLKANS